jgi:hypothetical protein
MIRTSHTALLSGFKQVLQRTLVLLLSMWVGLMQFVEDFALALNMQLHTHAFIKDFTALVDTTDCTTIQTQNLVTISEA